MNTVRFKTNIKCAACIEKVTPFLNEVAGHENWQVDTTTPEKILSVPAGTSEDNIKSALSKAGYKADLCEPDDDKITESSLRERL